MSKSEALLVALVLVLAALVVAQARTVHRLRRRNTKRAVARDMHEATLPAGAVQPLTPLGKLVEDERMPPGALLVLPGVPADSQFHRVFGPGARTPADVQAARRLARRPPVGRAVEPGAR